MENQTIPMSEDHIRFEISLVEDEIDQLCAEYDDLHIDLPNYYYEMIRYRESMKAILSDKLRELEGG